MLTEYRFTVSYSSLRFGSLQRLTAKKAYWLLAQQAEVITTAWN
jgi:hypothetical protein